MQEQKITQGLHNLKDSVSIQAQLIHTMHQEIDALAGVIKNFPDNAWQLVQLMATTTGKVVFSGLGKSGLVAQKLAATCSSMGIPSFFLHPNDALHGDLGVVQKNDLFIALSKSASGDEFDYILPILQAAHVTTCLICCCSGRLVDKADLIVMLPLSKEACMLNLAPTSSSTIMMAFGDALAVATSSIKGLTKQEFVRYHPAGALGKRLVLTVKQLMHPKESLAFVQSTTPFKDVLIAITSKKLGLGIIIDQAYALKGIITDGDLRRACELGPEVFSKAAADIATYNPKCVSPQVLAYVALEIMEEFNITSLVVVDQGCVVGLVHIHDIIKAGIRS